MQRVTWSQNLKLWFFFFILLNGRQVINSQNDVMMQAFYWDVPVDDINRNGTWWDSLAVKANDLKSAGFTALWVPSPAKGNWGIWDMGYGIYDHYDLGNYLQKGSTETRFGSRNELSRMMAAMHDTTGGKPRIELIADIILNHIYGSNENMEPNPAVKGYVFDEAFRHGKQFVPYPANEIIWVIPNAQPGNYHIKIKGYHHNFSLPVEKRGYDFQIDYNGHGFSDNYMWELEPNNGLGQFNKVLFSGTTCRGFVHYQNDVDEYMIRVDSVSDIRMRLTAREISGGNWVWSDQTRGLYPFEIWHDGENIAGTSLQAHTATGIKYPEHTGLGEPNYSWNFSHFHPSDGQDWLGDWGTDDEIISNTKGYGNDLNTFSEAVQHRMNDWGKWLVNEVGFDGFRLDFVRGFQESYAASWVNNLPKNDGNQRFVVGEYWGNARRIHQWVNTMADLGAHVNAFDFPLKSVLTDMCNGNAGFDMNVLNYAGMVRNHSNHHLPSTNVVTFLENHDTGKEHDKWVTKDWHLGYAYLLTHEGRPCIFYPHFYGVKLEDYHYQNESVKIPVELGEEIRKLIFIRNTYLDGTLEVLSQTGNPFPNVDAKNVYVARRQGNRHKKGAIIVLNNSNESKGLWVDATPSGWYSFNNKKLVNVFNSSKFTRVAADGRIWLEAPARGYTIYVLEEDFVAYTR